MAAECQHRQNSALLNEIVAVRIRVEEVLVTEWLPVPRACGGLTSIAVLADKTIAPRAEFHKIRENRWSFFVASRIEPRVLEHDYESR